MYNYSRRIVEIYRGEIMNIIEIMGEYLTGDPAKDTIILAILFTVFWSFYNVIFEAVFSIFKKGKN